MSAAPDHRGAKVVDITDRLPGYEIHDTPPRVVDRIAIWAIWFALLAAVLVVGLIAGMLRKAV